MSKQFIVTIGRQYGSGGHEIAEKIAQKMNVKIYDRNMLDEIANGNDAVRESFKDLDIETLTVINEQRAVNDTQQGVTSNVAEGQDQGDGSNDEEAERKERFEAVGSMFSELNIQEE